METQVPPNMADTAQLVIIQKKLLLDSKIRSGLNWYFWIAGLSLVNTIAYLFGNSITFVIGLGITQLVDGFMYGLAQELDAGGNIARGIGFVIDLFLAGIFVSIGILGRKGYRIPIIVGMVLYALDGIILLLFQDFFGAGFHAFALIGIGGALKSISELAELEKDGNSESIESLRKRAPSLQPQATQQQVRTRWVLMGLIFLVIFITTLIISFQQ